MLNHLRLVLFAFASVFLVSAGKPLVAAGGAELPAAARAAISRAIEADLADSPFEEAKLESGAVDDAFANAVAISGDTVVVGARFGHPAAAYVFVRPPSGWADTSTFDAKLAAAGGVPNDAFGVSVAIEGDTVVVGANQLNSGSKGAAYVYVRPATGWASTSAFDAKLTAFDGTIGDAFGTAVAIADGTIVVGAFNAKIGANRRGALYVFEMPVSGWTTTSAYEARLAPSGGGTGDALGASLGLRGDTLIAGAPGAGAAWIFVKPASGWISTSSFAAKLTAGGPAGDGFGQSTAISEDVAAVGAPFTKVGANDMQGAVYVYEKPGTGWASTSAFDAKLTAADGAVQDYFGLSVALSERILAAGAPSEVGHFRPGAVYLFVRPPDGWQTTSAFDAKLTVFSNASVSDFFGASVAISGRELAAGALGPSFARGAAYVFGGLPLACEPGRECVTPVEEGAAVGVGSRPQ